MSFLYFFPGVQENGLNAQNIRQRLGLQYLHGTAIRKLETLSGPEKTGRGLCVSYGDTAPKVLPDQVWSKNPLNDGWLGYSPGNYPTPETLARERQIPGSKVTIAGKQWLVPIARAWTDECNPYCALPTVSALQEDGTWANARVRDDFVGLWDIACKWWDVLAEGMASDTSTLSFNEENEWCVAALATNYFLSAAEVSVLGLLDDTTRGDILSALVDLPKFVRLIDEAEKKTKEIEPELVASG